MAVINTDKVQEIQKSKIQLFISPACTATKIQALLRLPVRIYHNNISCSKSMPSHTLASFPICTAFTYQHLDFKAYWSPIQLEIP